MADPDFRFFKDEDDVADKRLVNLANVAFMEPGGQGTTLVHFVGTTEKLAIGDAYVNIQTAITNATKLNMA